MHNWVSLFSQGASGWNSLNKTTLLGAIAGLTLGAIVGNQTDFFFWQAEIEWGILGMLLGVLSVQIVNGLSKLEIPLLTKYAMTLIFTLLSLQSWQTINHLLLETFPLLEKWTLLFGLLFCPLLSWHISLRLSSSLTDPKKTEESPSTSDSTAIPEPPKLLDSSSIIDGRILSLCKTGFLQGRLLVPKCILQELQLLADSPHSDKRIRGKRGLEILSQLRTLPTIALVIPDEDIRMNLPVDEKLLTLAKTLKGLIITNDWNLAQVANLQGLTTLNINELTYELRPLILPGQTIRVFIQKEGQSPGQGAAHLDDGTLVIIDHGSPAIGQIAEVQVTRYMQTNSGRMIFASLTESLAINSA
ncbi:MAG: PIN/TRAM domain-containing protein [Nitrospirales bacterium]